MITHEAVPDLDPTSYRPMCSVTAIEKSVCDLQSHRKNEQADNREA